MTSHKFKISHNQRVWYLQGFCKGDSGSPLITYDHTFNYWTLIGIVNQGGDCGDPFNRLLYSRTTTQLDWIKSHITGQTCERPSS